MPPLVDNTANSLPKPESHNIGGSPFPSISSTSQHFCGSNSQLMSSSSPQKRYTNVQQEDSLSKGI